MTKDELKKILYDHRKWLKDEGGERADLRGADLECADLRRADLRGADLQCADLRRADLRGADLEDAYLKGADLRDADLKGADLDYSCMPLWCGDLKANYDEKQIIQQLFHVLSHVKYSYHSTDRLKEILLKDEILNLANEFHRVEECGEIANKKALERAKKIIQINYTTGGKE